MVSTEEQGTVAENAIEFKHDAELIKYITYGDKSTQDFKNDYYEQVYRDSIENREAFFDREA